MYWLYESITNVYHDWLTDKLFMFIVNQFLFHRSPVTLLAFFNKICSDSWTLHFLSRISGQRFWKNFLLLYKSWFSCSPKWQLSNISPITVLNIFGDQYHMDFWLLIIISFLKSPQVNMNKQRYIYVSSTIPEYGTSVGK